MPEVSNRLELQHAEESGPSCTQQINSIDCSASTDYCNNYCLEAVSFNFCLNLLQQQGHYSFKLVAYAENRIGEAATTYYQPISK